MSRVKARQSFLHPSPLLTWEPGSRELVGCRGHMVKDKEDRSPLEWVLWGACNFSPGV